MPRINRRIRSRRRDVLTAEQALDLICGEALRAFDSDEQRRDAWDRHRDEVIAHVGPCCRPAAFWKYEHPEIACDDQNEATLRRLGLLTPEEKKVLRKWAASRPAV
jgi:hypothetical protein